MFLDATSNLQEAAEPLIDTSDTRPNTTVPGVIVLEGLRELLPSSLLDIPGVSLSVLLVVQEEVSSEEKRRRREDNVIYTTGIVSAFYDNILHVLDILLKYLVDYIHF